MTSLIHRTIETNGIRMHIVEAGEGPLVVMLHGFPEGWYAWRNQLSVLADAGYHAVAADQCGYGQTDRPAEIQRYSMFCLVGDAVGLITALGETSAVVVGHDWGATVAWITALFRPDLVRGVAALSVPHRPRGSRPPLDVYRQALGPRFYQLYYQEPGVAEREFEAEVSRTIRALLCGLSGQAARVHDLLVTENGMLDSLEMVDPLPTWLTESDIEHWTAEFGRTGFAGGLNWYRNINANWELMAPWSGASVMVPALYVVGDRDLVHGIQGALYKHGQPSQPHQVTVDKREGHVPRGNAMAADGLERSVPYLTRTVVLEGCGHWTQQERPVAVNGALLDFIRQL